MYKLKQLTLLMSLLSLLYTTKSNCFRFESIFDEMEQKFAQLRQDFKNMFSELKSPKLSNLTPEEQLELNQAITQASSMKPEITKNEAGIVTIAFPIDGIDKEKIEVALENGILTGIIPLPHGVFRFHIKPFFIEGGYNLEFKKETKDEEQKNDKDKPSIKYSSYVHSDYFVNNLPLEVDILKAQSETKGNKLHIRLQPKSYARLKIKHN